MRERLYQTHHDDLSEMSHEMKRDSYSDDSESYDEYFKSNSKRKDSKFSIRSTKSGTNAHRFSKVSLVQQINPLNNNGSGHQNLINEEEFGSKLVKQQSHLSLGGKGPIPRDTLFEDHFRETKKKLITNRKSCSVDREKIAQKNLINRKTINPGLLPSPDKKNNVKSDQIDQLVNEKHLRREQFESLGVVKPEKKLALLTSDYDKDVLEQLRDIAKNSNANKIQVEDINQILPPSKFSVFFLL